MKEFLKKIFVTSPDSWATTSKERKSYYSFFAGQNSIYALITNYLTTYLLFIGVNPTSSATVMLIVKVWDAVNDALFGVIFDKVKFKSGKKFLPWIRVSSILTPVATILLFAIPNVDSEKLKLCWFAVAYLIWDGVYTISDAPIYGIITSLTNNLDERNALLSYKSIWGGAGSGFTGIVVPFFLSSVLKLNYTLSATFLGVLCLLTMIPAGFTLNERFEGHDEETFTLKRMFSYLFKNKYLFIYFLGFFFWSSLNIGGNLSLYESYYLFHNELFLTITGFVGVVPSLLMNLLVPKILKKIDKMKFYRISLVLFIVIGLVQYFCGYNSLVLFIVLSVFRSIPSAAIGAVMFMFTPDCAEYGYFKTGIEAKGITFAIQTFMCKLTGAISSSLSLYLLGLKSVGFKTYTATNFDELNKMGAVQTPHTMNALWFICMIVPIIGAVAALICWCFYRLKDKDVQVMIDCNCEKISREQAEKELRQK